MPFFISVAFLHFQRESMLFLHRFFQISSVKHPLCLLGLIPKFELKDWNSFVEFYFLFLFVAMFQVVEYLDTHFGYPDASFHIWIPLAPSIFGCLPLVSGYPLLAVQVTFPVSLISNKNIPYPQILELMSEYVKINHAYIIILNLWNFCISIH